MVPNCVILLVGLNSFWWNEYFVALVRLESADSQSLCTVRSARVHEAFRGNTNSSIKAEFLHLLSLNFSE